MVPYEWFKWTLVIVGALLSGGVLVLTFWSAVKDDTKRVAVIVTSLIFICHLLLATGFVVSVDIICAISSDFEAENTVKPVLSDYIKQ